MMAITTSNSISVNPLRRSERTMTVTLKENGSEQREIDPVCAPSWAMRQSLLTEKGEKLGACTLKRCGYNFKKLLIFFGFFSYLAAIARNRCFRLCRGPSPCKK